MGIDARFTGSFVGHTLRHIEGKYPTNPHFSPERIFDLFQYLKEQNLDLRLARKMLPEVYNHPGMDFESVLTILKFKRNSREELVGKIDFLSKKFDEIALKNSFENKVNWIMGRLHHVGLGNISLSELRHIVEQVLKAK